MINGTVVQYHRDTYRVLPDGGTEPVTAQLRTWQLEQMKQEDRRQSLSGEFTFARQAGVGDRVQITCKDEDNWFIDEIEPRMTWLARVGPRRFKHQAQLIVTNATQLAVVVTARPKPKCAFIDRCLLAAIQGGMDALVIVNKYDLDPGFARSSLLLPYRKLGLKVHFTSATDGYGMDKLRDSLHGEATVLAGLSGVGKSTLINALTGTDLTTFDAHGPTGQGRHTTVTARMIKLGEKSWLVDTPGIRSYQLAGVTRELLDSCFTDIASLAAGCKFRDCSHTSEPGCRILDQVESGNLPAERVKSYTKLLAEVQAK